MSYSWEADQYKKERDELKVKLNSTKLELTELKGALFNILKDVNSLSDNHELSYNDFKYYFLAAAHSEENAIRDQFSALLVTFVMFFGEDLQKIKTEELRQERERDEQYKERMLVREKNKKEYNLLVAERLKEKEACIDRRNKLLIKISSGRYVIEDFNAPDRADIAALYDTGHIRMSILFSRLLVKNFNDIPLENDDDYYKAKEHPHYYNSRGHGMGFYFY